MEHDVGFIDFDEVCCLCFFCPRYSEVMMVMDFLCSGMMELHRNYQSQPLSREKKYLPPSFHCLGKKTNNTLWRNWQTRHRFSFVKAILVMFKICFTYMEKKLYIVENMKKKNHLFGPPMKCTQCSHIENE